MAHLSRSVATLRIIGDDLNPDEISSLLECEPTYATTKGQIIVSKSGRERVAKSGGWDIDAPSSEPENLDRQVSFILEKLNKDLKVWGKLKFKYKMDLFCGLFMNTSDEGLTISPKTLEELGRRGIELGLCLYAPDNCGPKFSDLCPCESGKIYGECCAKIENA